MAPSNIGSLKNVINSINMGKISLIIFNYLNDRLIDNTAEANCSFRPVPPFNTFVWLITHFNNMPTSFPVSFYFYSIHLAIHLLHEHV